MIHGIAVRPVLETNRGYRGGDLSGRETCLEPVDGRVGHDRYAGPPAGLVALAGIFEVHVRRLSSRTTLYARARAESSREARHGVAWTAAVEFVAVPLRHRQRPTAHRSHPWPHIRNHTEVDGAVTSCHRRRLTERSFAGRPQRGARLVPQAQLPACCAARNPSVARRTRVLHPRSTDESIAVYRRGPDDPLLRCEEQLR